MPSFSTEHLQIQTTAGSQEEAKRIARALVDARLAACVQILGPIASRYRWRDKVEEAEEWLCLAKTTRGHYQGAEKAIKAAHSYDEPEIIATSIVEGSHGYLAWLEENVEAG